MLSANRVWHNAFKGERVYMIANGPSLRSFDRSEFRGRRLIVMNWFDRAAWKHEVDIVVHGIGEPRSPIYGADPAENINGADTASEVWLLSTQALLFLPLFTFTPLYVFLCGALCMAGASGLRSSRLLPRPPEKIASASVV